MKESWKDWILKIFTAVTGTLIVIQLSDIKEVNKELAKDIEQVAERMEKHLEKQDAQIEAQRKLIDTIKLHQTIDEIELIRIKKKLQLDY